jgi:putative ABC transport system ATP-binding protein
MIKVRNVTKVFNQGKPNEMTALQDVSFSVGANELVILKGPSGSGKSTVLSLIAALQKPTSGEVIVEETRVSKLPDDFASLFRREKIGFVFQKFNLIPTLSVFDNIVTPLIPEKLSEKELEAKAERVMEEFSIGHKRDDLTKNLSGGEQQRVAIARALVNDPPIILADEPTANLDAKLAEQFLEYVKRIKEEGKTILIATHDPLFFNLPITDREITLHNGRVV